MGCLTIVCNSLWNLKFKNFLLKKLCARISLHNYQVFFFSYILVKILALKCFSTTRLTIK